MKFYYIYKALAHPENNGYVAPFTIKERLMHVAEAKQKLGTRFNWIADSIDNKLKHALGNAPNSEFLIDPKGKVVVARPWSRPSDLRADLERIFGKVANPTSIADVGMKPLPPTKTAPKGIVPRVSVSGRMSPVIVKPIIKEDSDVFYAKLRAEVGNGKLYLGFFLDPIYKVHWNNQTRPISYSMEVPDGLKLTPTTGSGPEVEEDADADPREFLLEYSGQSDKPIKLTVKYFACDDAETFCKPMTQQYEVTLERDRDGGSRRSSQGRGRPQGNAGRRPGQQPGARPGGQPGQGQRGPMFAEMVKRMDANGDGKISKSEARGPFAQRFSRMDSNSDGIIDKDELAETLKRIQGQSSRPGGRPRPERRPGS